MVVAMVAAPYTLDASALLAMLNGEPGGEVVLPLLDRAVMSSVNWAEVLQRCLALNVDIIGMQTDLEALGLQIYPFTAEDAERTAELHSLTRSLGLSLGDRACLSLAQHLNSPVYTADRIWETLTLGIEIQVIR